MAGLTSARGGLRHVHLDGHHVAGGVYVGTLGGLGSGAVAGIK